MKILITGGRGYVAKSLFNFFKDIYEVTIVTRNDFDLNDCEQTSNFFKGRFFDIVIHCAIVGGSRLEKESWDVMDKNLRMYYNLHNCRSSYNKLISFGSGAEIYSPNTPYGYSKYVIRKSIQNNDGFFNIRIFAVFDENELNTRFIKSNLLKHIDGENLYVFGNKKMDFFYMKDLISVVDFYIKEVNPPKEYNCTYQETKTVLEIAKYISQLDGRKSEILLDGTSSQNYNGEFTPINVNLIGLEQGIKSTYEKLKVIPRN